MITCTVHIAGILTDAWCTIYRMDYSDKKVILVGGSGFIGTQLALRLLSQGARVVVIDPRPSPLKEVVYVKSDLTSYPEDELLEKPFAIFNLAGVPIFGRWTKSYKKLVRSSRIDTTRVLVEALQNERYRPEYLVSTSAIGVYGDRGNDMLDENSKPVANTYLAQVAAEWEAEAWRAREYGVSVHIVRNAHVLGKGGILGTLQKVFKTGLGGPLGSGRQYMSFVSMDKCLDAYVRAPFEENAIKNAVSIEPVTNRDFSHMLARLMGRPCLFRIPVWAMSIVYGEFAREIVTSQRVFTAFEPRHEDLEEVLKSLLSKNK